MRARALICCGAALLASRTSDAAEHARSDVAASNARESASDFTLVWNAPPTCPAAAAVRADTLQLVGERPTLHALNAQGNVSTLGPGRWELDLSLELDGALGERHLSADSCAAIAEAAAVMFALMLNPDASLAVRSSSETFETEGTGLHVAADVGVGVGFGVLPLPNPELRVGLGVSIGAAQLWLDGAAGLHQELDVANGKGGGVRWTALGARACWAFEDGAMSLAPCLVSELNRLAGRGTGVDYPQDGSIAWLDVGAGAVGSVALSERASLYLQLQALRPLARPRAFLQDLGELVRPAAANAHLALGVRVRFW